MRFHSCFFLASAGFVAAWALWYASSSTSSPPRSLTKFDAAYLKPTPDPGAEEQPPRRQIHVKRTPESYAREGTTRSQQEPAPAQLERADATPVVDEPYRPQSAGVGIQQLHVLVQGDFGGRLLEILRRERCHVVAFQVDGGATIRDALIPSSQGDLTRATGPSGTDQVNAFIGAHPTQRHLWVRLDTVHPDIAGELKRVLDGHGKKLSDYAVYIVLGEAFSQRVHAAIEAEAHEQGMAMGNVAYVRVALRPSGAWSRLEPVVIELVRSPQPLDSPGHGAGPTLVPDPEPPRSHP